MLRPDVYGQTADSVTLHFVVIVTLLAAGQRLEFGFNEFLGDHRSILDT
jgi:hypothetical protein